MVKKCLTLFLIALLCNTQLFAQTQNNKQAAKEAARIEKLKAAITTIGLGDTAPAEVKLKNGGKLIGYVSEMKDGSISFAETAIATTREISYAEIEAIKPYKPKGKSKVPWAIIATVGITAVVVAVAIKVCNDRKKRGETCETEETY